MVVKWLEACQPATFTLMSESTGLDQQFQEQIGVVNGLRLCTYPNSIGVELKEFSKGYQLLYCYIGTQFLSHLKEVRQLQGEAIAQQLNRQRPAIFSFSAHFSGQLSVMLYTQEVETKLQSILQQLCQFFKQVTKHADVQLFFIVGDKAYQVTKP